MHLTRLGILLLIVGAVALCAGIGGVWVGASPQWVSPLLVGAFIALAAGITQPWWSRRLPRHS